MNIPLSKQRVLATLLLALLAIAFPTLERDLREVLSLYRSDPISHESLEAKVLVERVVDGDTVVITGGEKVRLIGVDAPESVKPHEKPECFGMESSQYLKELVEGKEVMLQRDVSDRDRYGRLLRYVYLEGTLLNELLVQEGYAREKSYPPDTTQKQQLESAEEEAQRDMKGLWKECPLL